MTRGRSTIYEVARRSGVSTATVSRAMRDGAGMSADTRDRVLAVAAELHWIPDGRARGLATRRSGIVGVLFHDLGVSGDAESESPLYLDEVIRGAERAATSAGDALLIAATRGRSGRELAFSVAGKVDGLVILARSVTAADIRALAQTVPVVTVSTRDRGDPYDHVSVDNRGAMRALVEHLIVVHGYTDLVFVGGPARSPDSMERFGGYRDAMRAHRLPVLKTPDADGAFTEVGGSRAASTLLATRPPPKAIVCGNDEMAIGALSVLRTAKLNVPGDVAITGFDDIASGRHVRPPLTTVHQPMRDVGESAVSLLLQRIASPTAERQTVVLPTVTRIRRSCGCGSRRAAGGADRSAHTTSTGRREKVA
ncbi:MAG: LacI family transcriptional regulator [Nocardioidaceae bacterium]|nr:LacI family transcriptional regulator [Nocardioidaceae bacterium]